MDSDTKNIIILVLVVTMFIVLVVELMYIRSKKKKKISKFEETRADEAFNKIHTTDRIISTMRSQGVDVQGAEQLLKEARQYESRRDFVSAIESAERSKIILKNAKRDHDLQRSSDQDESNPSVIDNSSKKFLNDDPLLPMPKDIRSGERPANFMQAKFLLATVKDLLNEDENQGIEEANLMFKEASEEFEKENYTKALSLALKTEKMLKVGSFEHIAETPMPHTDEDGEETGDEAHQSEPTVIEEIIENGAEDAACDSCGADAHVEDSFCRKCGNELEFIIICPSCDAEVENDDVFCRKCGQKLD